MEPGARKFKAPLIKNTARKSFPRPFSQQLLDSLPQTILLSEEGSSKPSQNHHQLSQKPATSATKTASLNNKNNNNARGDPNQCNSSGSKGRAERLPATKSTHSARTKTSGSCQSSGKEKKTCEYGGQQTDGKGVKDVSDGFSGKTSDKSDKENHRKSEKHRHRSHIKGSNDKIHKADKSNSGSHRQMSKDKFKATVEAEGNLHESKSTHSTGAKTVSGGHNQEGTSTRKATAEAHKPHHKSNASKSTHNGKHVARSENQNVISCKSAVADTQAETGAGKTGQESKRSNSSQRKDNQKQTGTESPQKMKSLDRKGSDCDTKKNVLEKANLFSSHKQRISDIQLPNQQQQNSSKAAETKVREEDNSCGLKVVQHTSMVKASSEMIDSKLAKSSFVHLTKLKLGNKIPRHRQIKDSNQKTETTSKTGSTTSSKSVVVTDKVSSSCKAKPCEDSTKPKVTKDSCVNSSPLKRKHKSAENLTADSNIRGHRSQDSGKPSDSKKRRHSSSESSVLSNKDFCNPVGETSKITRCDSKSASDKVDRVRAMSGQPASGIHGNKPENSATKSRWNSGDPNSQSSLKQISEFRNENSRNTPMSSTESVVKQRAGSSGASLRTILLEDGDLRTKQSLLKRSGDLSNDVEKKKRKRNRSGSCLDDIKKVLSLKSKMKKKYREYFGMQNLIVSHSKNRLKSQEDKSEDDGVESSCLESRVSTMEKVTIGELRLMGEEDTYRQIDGEMDLSSVSQDEGNLVIDMDDEEHTGADLHDRDPSGADLLHRDQSGANLYVKDGGGADLHDKHQSVTNLHDKHQSVATQHTCNKDSSGVNLRDKDQSRANVRDKDQSGANLHDEDQGGARLRDKDKSGANLHDEDQSGARLRDKDQSGATQHNKDLSGANLHDEDQSGARLRDKDQSGATRLNKDLSGANLRDKDQSGAHLHGKDPSGANLRDKDQSGANHDQHQSGANMCGRDHSGAAGDGPSSADAMDLFDILLYEGFPDEYNRRKSAEGIGSNVCRDWAQSGQGDGLAKIRHPSADMCVGTALRAGTEKPPVTTIAGTADSITSTPIKKARVELFPSKETCRQKRHPEESNAAIPETDHTSMTSMTRSVEEKIATSDCGLESSRDNDSLPSSCPGEPGSIQQTGRHPTETTKEMQHPGKGIQTTFNSANIQNSASSTATSVQTGCGSNTTTSLQTTSGSTSSGEHIQSPSAVKVKQESLQNTCCHAHDSAESRSKGDDGPGIIPDICQPDNVSMGGSDVLDVRNIKEEISFNNIVEERPSESADCVSISSRKGFDAGSDSYNCALKRIVELCQPEDDQMATSSCNTTQIAQPLDPDQIRRPASAGRTSHPSTPSITETLQSNCPGQSKGTDSSIITLPGTETGSKQVDGNQSKSDQVTDLSFEALRLSQSRSKEMTNVEFLSQKPSSSEGPSVDAGIRTLTHVLDDQVADDEYNLARDMEQFQVKGPQDKQFANKEPSKNGAPYCAPSCMCITIPIWHQISTSSMSNPIIYGQLCLAEDPHKTSICCDYCGKYFTVSEFKLHHHGMLGPKDVMKSDLSLLSPLQLNGTLTPHQWEHWKHFCDWLTKIHPRWMESNLINRGVPTRNRTMSLPTEDRIMLAGNGTIPVAQGDSRTMPSVHQTLPSAQDNRTMTQCDRTMTQDNRTMTQGDGTVAQGDRTMTQGASRTYPNPSSQPSFSSVRPRGPIVRTYPHSHSHSACNVAQTPAYSALTLQRRNSVNTRHTIHHRSLVNGGQIEQSHSQPSYSQTVPPHGASFGYNQSYPPATFTASRSNTSPGQHVNMAASAFPHIPDSQAAMLVPANRLQIGGNQGGNTRPPSGGNHMGNGSSRGDNPDSHHSSSPSLSRQCSSGSDDIPSNINDPDIIQLFRVSQQYQLRALNELCKQRESSREEMMKLKLDLAAEVQCRMEMQSTVSSLKVEVDQLKNSMAQMTRTREMTQSGLPYTGHFSMGPFNPSTASNIIYRPPSMRDPFRDENRTTF